MEQVITKALVKNETGEHIMFFRTDNGGEYTSEAFTEYLHNEGICHQMTALHTSAENGKSEHLHRTLMNRARAIHYNSNLPPICGEKLSRWQDT